MEAAGSRAPFSVSVLIVNWNARDDLRECLRSVHAQADLPEEVVLVDNCSSDGSPEMVREEFPEVKLLEPGRNLGFAEGCNLGLGACSSEWVAALNNDATVDGRWLLELRAAARAAGPRVGSLQSHILFRQKPTHSNSTGIVVFANGRAQDRDFDEPLREETGTEEIFCPTAAAALYRRAMLDEVRLPSGYFDRGFFMYMEDVDLGWRCRLAGWESLYVPSSIVFHAFRASSSRRGRDFVDLQCRKNRLRTLLKNASFPFLLRSLGLSLEDILLINRQGGWRATCDVLVGLFDATVQRAKQRPLVKLSRRQVERRWMRPAPKGVEQDWRALLALLRSGAERSD